MKEGGKAKRLVWTWVKNWLDDLFIRILRLFLQNHSHEKFHAWKNRCLKMLCIKMISPHVIFMLRFLHAWSFSYRKCMLKSLLLQDIVYRQQHSLCNVIQWCSFIQWLPNAERSGATHPLWYCEPSDVEDRSFEELNGSPKGCMVD